MAGAGCGVAASDGTDATSEDALSSSVAAVPGAHAVDVMPDVATTQDTYYVTFFAYQQGINLTVNKENSHTFAQFVHVQPDGAGGVTLPRDDAFTISWMPASGVVRPFGPAEVGEDTDLDFELRRGAGVRNARAFAWGPYRIAQSTFARATSQRDLLSSGRVLYKASGRDPISRSTDYLNTAGSLKPAFLNCLAAVGDIGPDGGTVVGASSGRAGTQEVVDHFAPILVDAAGALSFHDRHMWLARKLNLSRFSALFADGLMLQEQRGRNAAPPGETTYASCFCMEQLVGRGIQCSFFGVTAGAHGAVAPLKTVYPAAYSAVGQCVSRCSADWSEYAASCPGGISDTGAP